MQHLEYPICISSVYTKIGFKYPKKIQKNVVSINNHIIKKFETFFL